MTATAASQEGATAGESRSYRYYVLAILIVVYTVNFIDRQIIGILAPAIKAELKLSDTQLGLLGGLAFAIFYTGLGIPIARLADRHNRMWIMTIALSLWSMFTALCGAASTFTQLFLARVGVGVGEAGGVAPAYALISDYFPRHERSRALAVYSFGIPIGGALGVLFGGLIATSVSWRAAFVTVGIAGLLIAPLFKLTVREPPRGRYDPPAPAHHETLGGVIRQLAAKPSFWGLSLGAASAASLSYGLAFWLPSFFLRSFQLTLVQTSLIYSAMLFVGGCTGIWLGGWLGDRLGAARPSMYATVPAIAFLISIPCYAVAVMAPSIEIAALASLVPQALGLLWLGPIITAVQHLVDARMRATASAAFLFVNNLIGLGVGTAFFGIMSDALNQRFGADALRYAILSGLVFYVISATILLATSRRLKQDLVA